MIYFNTVPPEPTFLPSALLGLQNAYLKKNNVPTRNIFWNLCFDKIMKKYSPKSIIEEHHLLIPFYILLAEIFQDGSKIELIKFILRESKPEFINNDYYFFENEISRIKEESIITINRIIDSIPINKNDLFIFTTNSYRWVSTIVISHYLKKRNPDCKIVLTDFHQTNKAIDTLQLSVDFDYAIYGTGIKEVFLLNNYLSTDNLTPEIPNLLYKKNHEISSINKFEYFTDEYFETPDFSDYYTEIIRNKDFDINTVYYPIINSISCPWSQCNFCMAIGNKYFNEKTIEKIFEEIEIIYLKFGVVNFTFHGLEFEGSRVINFNKLLDGLILIQKKLNVKFWFTGKLIPKPYHNTSIYKKLNSAGFEKILLGGESLSNRSLKRMNKSNSFSTNILAIKSSFKEEVIAYMNFMMGIPFEELTEIYENANNLHFIRFYLNKENHFFEFKDSSFFLGYGMHFFNQLDETEKKQYSKNSVKSCMPEELLEKLNFHHFALFRNSLINDIPWKLFKSIRSKYIRNNYTYKIEKNNTLKYYEYFNNKLITTIEFDDQIYIEILENCNDAILSFNSLIIKLTDYKISEEKLKTILDELKQLFLVYFDDNYNDIISVIHL